MKCGRPENLAEDLLVRHPAETTKSEQTPLVFAHSNVSQSLVDDLGFA